MEQILEVAETFQDLVLVTMEAFRDASIVFFSKKATAPANVFLFPVHPDDEDNCKL